MDDPMILKGIGTLEAQGYTVERWQTLGGSHIFTISRKDGNKPRLVTVWEVQRAMPDVPMHRLYPISGSVIVR
jgi:hypothetical protein